MRPLCSQGLAIWLCVAPLACAAKKTTPSDVSVPAGSSLAVSSAVTSASKVASATPAEVKVPDIRPDEGVGIVAGPGGHMGAWLALGPFRLDPKLPASGFRIPIRKENGSIDSTITPIDDAKLSPFLGKDIGTRVDVAVKGGWNHKPAAWTVACSGDGPIDLDKVFPTHGASAVGYLGTVLRLSEPRSLYLLLGVDDGVEVIVDGTSRFQRDVTRPRHEDEDAVMLDLPAGDHVILLKLRQRDANWAVRARFVDRATFEPPTGARFLLPGAGKDVADELARAMSWVRLERTPEADGHVLSTLVKYPEGAPIGIPLKVTGSLLEDKVEVLKPTELGIVPIEAHSSGELRATLGKTDKSFDERDFSLKMDVSGRIVEGRFRPRGKVHRVIGRARLLLTTWSKLRPSSMPEDVQASLEYVTTRLEGFVTRGDPDVTSQLLDADYLESLLDSVDKGEDPLATKTGVLRLAHVAKADGKPQPFVLYVPPKLPSRGKVPLYIGLHGMNGGPMSMMRIFFGGDDESKSMAEMERGMPTPKPLDGYVLAPHAHGNAMYRQLGEEEVLDLIAWAIARYPQIDPDRVSVTGFSMGGIGAASIPLHHPGRFAAAQPLCGYHNYFIRRDVRGKPVRPWETPLLDERSNTSWVEHGQRLPMWIIHGTKDLPVENSQVLIDAYNKHKFALKHDHPEKGHDVWGVAYEKRSHIPFLGGHHRTPHPRKVHIRTTRPRWGEDTWVHVDALALSIGWGTIDAHAVSKTQVDLKTKDIDALHLDRDETLFSKDPLKVTVDGKLFTFAPGDAIQLHRESGVWMMGSLPKAGSGKPGAERKSGNITGPIRDVFHEPLVIIYGTEDPSLRLPNLEVARALGAIRYGTDVMYPLLKDVDVDPKAPPTTSVILVGNAKSNRITREFEPKLPIRLANGKIDFAGKSYSGKQLGAIFVVPHPLDSTKYLLVVEGADALGMLRAQSLPDLLPDFVIWDESLAPARGHVLLGPGSVLAAGMFDVNWKSPVTFEDPLRTRTIAAAKSEKEGTAYLP